MSSLVATRARSGPRRRDRFRRRVGAARSTAPPRRPPCRPPGGRRGGDGVARAPPRWTARHRHPTSRPRPPRRPPSSLPVPHAGQAGFDNCFATYPGADGLPIDTCVPVRIHEPDGDYVKPYWIDSSPDRRPRAHPERLPGPAQRRENDGSIEAFADEGDPTKQAMRSTTTATSPLLGRHRRLVLFGRFFASARGGGVEPHAPRGRATQEPAATASPPTASATCPPSSTGSRRRGSVEALRAELRPVDHLPRLSDRRRRDKGAQVVSAPLLAYGRYLDDPELFGKIVPLARYYTDLAEGTLPSVAYVVPSGRARPPGSIQARERSIRNLTRP